VPVQQVMLEARIVEVSTEAAKELGIDWNLLNRQGVILVEGPNPGSSSAGSPPTDLGFIDPTPGTRDWYKLRPVTRQAKTFQIALDMLIEDGDARVLANPKIATLNGREASMLIGTRIPFTVTGVVSGGGAGAGVATQKLVEREEVGIKLRITPTINPDGYITTVINPEVSSVTGFTGEFNDLPIVSTRQASTTVRLKDGNSIIIGGLLSEEKTNNITKLPILGQIPGIGVLFQHHSVTMNKKDLVIEVTPHIMPEQR
jgi:type II secretory pathway component GspD/PulD (secretin)